MTFGKSVGNNPTRYSCKGSYPVMGVYRARSLLGLSAEALHRLLIGWLGDPDLQYGP